MELMVLVEDPQAATIRLIVAEAAAQLATLQPAAGGRGQGITVHVAAHAGAPLASTHAPAAWQAQKVATGPLWVSPAPVAIKMRIFCLPYAGGVSENVFARWAQLLPASVQVCPVEIPGRGRREGEPAINDVKELARLLARSLPLSDKPYAIFGTCLGAIIGYEIAREVEESRCAPMPLALFTAAVSPPHLYAVAVMKLYLQRKLGRREEPPVEEVMNILRGWKDLPKHILLKAFEAGNFAGVEEMRRNDRLFERVAPMGVNDIMMAVQYRCGEPCLAAQAGCSGVGVCSQPARRKGTCLALTRPTLLQAHRARAAVHPYHRL